MQEKLFTVGAAFGVQEANTILTVNAAATLPTSGVDTGIVVLYTPENCLYRFNGASWDRIPPVPPATAYFFTGSVPVDVANDGYTMIETPSTIATAQLKLLGLAFPTWVYENPAISKSFNSDYTDIAHAHSVSISQSTGENSANHTHSERGDGSTYNTGPNSANHTHTLTASVTSGSAGGTHRHGASFTITKSSNKPNPAGNLVKVYRSIDGVNWVDIALDFSALFGATGTAYIDVKSYLVAGNVNFIKFKINTTGDYGLNLVYMFKIS